MDLLDEWSPALNEDQKNKVLRDNFRKINTAMQFMGAELISDVNSRIAQSVTSTTYVTLTAFNGSFQSSGGLVIIVATLALASNAGLSADLNLLIDSESKKVQSHALNYNPDHYATMVWASNVLAGKHTVSIQAKVSGNTLTVGSTSADSGYYIFEFRKG